MLTDIRKLLDRVGARVGFARGELRTRVFRHAFTAALLQTLDRGQPISLFTAGRMLGHGGESMIRRVYGHLGDVRVRSEVVEFQVSQHAALLKNQLGGLRPSGPLT